MCHWSKGVKLRYILGYLEQWIKSNKLEHSGAVETLETVFQASLLLQAIKSESDIKNICSVCPKLTVAQIKRILFMYTPIEAHEEKLNREFIENITKFLKKLRVNENKFAQEILLLDTQKQFPISIPFNPSNINLETIELPEKINLKGVLKKI